MVKKKEKRKAFVNIIPQKGLDNYLPILGIVVGYKDKSNNKTTTKDEVQLLKLYIFRQCFLSLNFLVKNISLKHVSNFC